MSVTFCESKRKTVFAVVVSAAYAVSVLLNFFMDVIRWNTVLISLLQLAAPVCVVVYLAFSQRENFFKNLLLPLGFLAFPLFNVNRVITLIPSIFIYAYFSLYVLALIPVLLDLALLAAGVLCVLGCAMKNKRSLLKVGALLYSIVWAIGWIGIIGNIAVAVFTDRISSNGVAIYTEVYNGGFALLPPIFLILFCFSIFLLTTEKKAKNLNELLH